jgi:hypothetical protein
MVIGTVEWLGLAWRRALPVRIPGGITLGGSPGDHGGPRSYSPCRPGDPRGIMDFHGFCRIWRSQNPSKLKVFDWKPINLRPDSDLASKTDPYTIRVGGLGIPRTAWCIERALPTLWGTPRGEQPGGSSWGIFRGGSPGGIPRGESREVPQRSWDESR